MPNLLIVCDFEGAILDRGTRVSRPIELMAFRNSRLAGVAEADTVDGPNHAVLEPTFPEFVRWCGKNGHALCLVSDGLESAALAVLRRHRLGDLVVFGRRNVDESATGGDYWSREGCASRTAVCRCAVAGVWSTPRWAEVAYVGRSRAGFCLSARVDIVFADADLAADAGSRRQPYVPFVDFDDVARWLTRRHDAPAA